MFYNVLDNGVVQNQQQVITNKLHKIMAVEGRQSK